MLAQDQTLILDAAIHRMAKIRNASVHRLEGNVHPADRLIEHRIIRDLHQAIENKQKFKENNFSSNAVRIESLEALKEATLIVHKLNAFLRDNKTRASSFARRLYEKEERWLNMLNILQLAYLNRMAVESIRQTLNGATQTASYPGPVPAAMNNVVSVDFRNKSISE